MYVLKNCLMLLVISTLVLGQEAKDNSGERVQLKHGDVKDSEIKSSVLPQVETNDELKDKQSITSPLPRLSLVDSTDKERHVSHMLRPKDQNARKSGCKRSFTHRLQLYKELLKKDAAVIEYVSADPLPGDPMDSMVPECENTDELEQSTIDKNVKTLKDTSKQNHTANSNSTVKPSRYVLHPVTGSQVDDDLDFENDTVIELNVKKIDKIDFNSTVHAMNKTGENDDLTDGIVVAVENEEIVGNSDRNETIVKPATKSVYLNSSELNSMGAGDKKGHKDPLRRSDYIFSSDEYYDDKVDFDPNSCPADSVTVVTLEQALVTDSDPECILNVDWKNLE